MFLDALEQRARARAGARGCSPTCGRRTTRRRRSTAPGSFPYELPATDARKRRRRRRELRRRVRSRQPPFASNALLVGAKRSATGHPLFVAGPQVGYFFPEFFAEIDLGRGLRDAGRASSPASRSSLIGRGPDFAWSATSSQADNIDLFVETLCGGDDHHYLYRGPVPSRCSASTRHAEGAAGSPTSRSSYDETMHGPSSATRPSAGRGWRSRSSARREAASCSRARAFYDLDTGGVTSPQTFVKAMSASSSRSTGSTPTTGTSRTTRAGGCRCARREPTARCRRSGPAPTSGKASSARRSTRRRSTRRAGVILNWNNKPAADFGAADCELLVRAGPARRPLTPAIAKLKKHTLASVVVGDERVGDPGSARRAACGR